ncbi:MAG: FecR family protein [Niabella sp.]
MPLSDRIAQLFSKYVSNTISREELDELLLGIADTENAAVVERALYKVWSENTAADPVYSKEEWDELFDAHYLKLSGATIKKSKLTLLPGGLIKVAASLLAIVLCAAMVYYFIRKDNRSLMDRKETIVQQNNDIMPGGNNAVLTLSNGQQFILNDVPAGNVVKQQNLSVTKMKNEQLVFSYDSSVKGDVPEPDTGLNTVSTPRGGKYQVNLSDGTKIWLNSLTVLSFPAVFNGQTRKVKLSGEAYFEVAKNEKMPFVVESGTQTVRVLGTHFNIKAYSDEKETQTTLLEGRVEVAAGNHKVVMKPGQRARLNDNIIRVAYTDVYEAIDWKNGFIDLNDEDIKTVMQKISRWYDVDIQYQGNISDVKLGGAVSRDADISKVLEVLEATGAAHFKIEKRRIIVMP